MKHSNSKSLLKVANYSVIISNSILNYYTKIVFLQKYYFLYLLHRFSNGVLTIQPRGGPLAGVFIDLSTHAT